MSHIVVVDTNVAIAANGRDTHADLECQFACVEKLEDIVRDDVVAIDDHDLIIDEYKRHLNFSGQPDMGDMFFKHIVNHQYSDDRVKQVPITPVSDEKRGYSELPENSFDPSDRKFLAVAVVAKALIANATDSDWSENKALTDGLGIRVEQLCPQHATRDG